MLVAVVAINTVPVLAEEAHKGDANLIITGHIKDYRDYPVSYAVVKAYVNGKEAEVIDVFTGRHKEEAETSTDGGYSFGLAVDNPGAGDLVHRPRCRQQLEVALLSLVDDRHEGVPQIRCRRREDAAQVRSQA